MIGAMAVLSGFAAEKKESPFKALEEARAAFNKQNGEVFRGTKAADYRTLADTERFDKAPGASSWVIALPLKNDSRVRYVLAEFKDGQFVKGEMRKLGLKPESIDEKAFAALRADFAMLAAKAGSEGKDRTCAFYPAGKIKDTQQNDILPYGNQMRVDPNGRYVGGLRGIDRPLGVSMKNVKYVYTLTTPDGDVLEMGAAGNGKTMLPLMREKLEALHPGMKDRYSDRDLVDMYCKAWLRFAPARTF